MVSVSSALSWCVTGRKCGDCDSRVENDQAPLRPSPQRPNEFVLDRKVTAAPSNMKESFVFT